MRFRDFINEAPIHIDMQPIYARIKESKTFPQRAYLKKLTSLFTPWKLLFLPATKDMVTKNGVGKGAVSISTEGVVIKIYLNVSDIFYYKSEGMFAQYAMELAGTIEHELIHIEQLTRVVKQGKNIAAVLQKGGSGSSEKEYYGSEHELMAYANTIVRTLEAADFDKEEIIDMLRKPNDNITPYTASDWSGELEIYLNVFKDQPKVIKRLYKYMYMYLTKEEQ